MTEIVVPYLGAAVEEVTIVEWLKAAGDRIEVGEPLCSVATDKVDSEIEATAAGVISELAVPVGETVAIGTVLARLDGAVGTVDRADEPPPAGAPATAEAPADAPAPAASPVGRPAGDRSTTAVDPGPFEPAGAAGAVVVPRDDGQPLASPVARRIAAAHDVDLRHVAGSGRQGRITKADVEREIERGPRPAPADPAPAVASPAAPVGAPPADTELPRGYDGVPVEVVPHSRMRQVVAEHMVRSRRVAAHSTTATDVDLGRLEQARAAVNLRREQRGQRRLSPLPFIARAAAATLADFPDVNATFLDDRMLRWQDVNLGIAVEAAQGLLVPVVRRAQAITVDGIGDQIADLAGRARTGDLRADELGGGTFTITNVGPMGATAVVPTINQPQVAILGVPAAVRRPVVVLGGDGEEQIAIRPVVQLSLTFDHRAIDGAEATRCVVAIKQRIEEWTADAYA